MAPLLPLDRRPKRLAEPSCARAIRSRMWRDLALACAWGPARADVCRIPWGGKCCWTVERRLGVARQAGIRRQPDARPTRIRETRFLAETGFLNQELEGAGGQNGAQDGVLGRLIVESGC
jgi:hypothetical protein